MGVTPIKIYSYLVEGKKLILHQYKLSLGIVKALAYVLPFFKNLEMISLSENTLEDNGLAVLIEATMHLPKFRSLKIMYNKPRTLFMETLYQSIYERSRILKVINLKGCLSINSQFSKLIKILNRLLDLQSLNLSDMKLDVSAIQQLSKYIRTNETITKLTMSNSGLISNKAFMFIKSLIKNDSICFLDLSYNNFTSDDYSIAAAIGTLIKCHYYLMHVNFSHCAMSVEETMYVGVASKDSNQLMACHLTGNSCHVYGRAHIRTQLGAEPQYPSKRKMDSENYISQIDVTLLMVFSNFYKQRILPNEIKQFFVFGKRDVIDVDIETNIDYLKVLEDDIETAKRSKLSHFML